MLAQEIIKQAADCKIGDSLEGWKDVVGYEGLYKVSDSGQIRSKRFAHRNLSPLGKTQRYLKVRLYNEAGWIARPIHQLVGEAFIPNQYQKPQINHLNGDKKDNRAINLEWVTAKENCYHRVHSLGIKPKGKPKRAIIAYNDKWEIRFESVFEAQKDGYTETAIYRSMRKGTQRYTHKGYKWRYAE